jgi:fatty-acyl-CoA synthase
MKLPCDTIPEAIINAATDSGTDQGYTFISENGKSETFYSFREIAENAARYGRALVELGLQKGDRLGIILPNSRDFGFCFFGAMHARLIAVPLSPPMSIGKLGFYLENIKHILKASEASVLITVPQIKRLLGSLLGGNLKKIVTLDKIDVAGDGLGFAPPNADDIAFIQFTSGSTARPKGVGLTHRNLISNAHCIMNLGLHVTERDVACSWLPLFHDMGLIGFMLSPFLTRTSAVFLPPLRFLKRPVEWLQMITRHRGTITFAPNFAYGLCTKRVAEHNMEGLDLSSLRVAGCGAEPIELATLEDFSRKFSAVKFQRRAFLPCYGIAESTLAVTFIGLDESFKADCVDLERLTGEGVAAPVAPDSAGAVKVVCCGKAFAEHEVRITDDNGQTCGEREVGEIVLRGPSVMQGYYNNRKATAEARKNGWLHTGDLGYLYEGELYVCGRIKDLIIISGKNYYPMDIEWAVSDIDGVRKGNVVAFGVQQIGHSYEHVVVCAETKNSPADYPKIEKNIKIRVREVLGLKLHDVVMLKPGTLPKTSSGKLQRNLSKKLYSSGDLGVSRKNQGKLGLLAHLTKSQWNFFKHRR